MNSYSIVEIFQGKATLGLTVTVEGWLRTRRDSKAGISFLHVHDGSCFAPLQIVAANTLANYANDVLKLTPGCAVVATGKLVASQGKGQKYEIQAEEIKVVGWVDDSDTYPIQPKHHTLEYLREVAHLRARTHTLGAVARIRQTAAHAIHCFFEQQGYVWLPTPIITTSDCEGAGELFRVSTLDFANLPRAERGEVDFSQDFFGKETFLTVSGQLNAESYALALKKVYAFGPTFRAENSNTSRHLAEFWMVEPEIAFADLNDVAKLAEQLLKHVFMVVLEQRPDDMEFFANRIEKACIERLAAIINSQFEIVDYSDAVAALEKARQPFEYPIRWGMDLHTEHERYITEKLLNRPVIIVNYPKDVKAFYMRMNDDNKTVAAMDVLAPGMGEIIGGAQREERLVILDQRMKELGLAPESIQWYRDLRRYGSVPHAGFGLGFERLLSYITGLSNVRDLIPFPRTPGNAEF